MFKYIKQHDERDCGAACLSMIATYYGLRYPISKYRDLTKTDRNGANLYGLTDAAEKIGFKAEALSGKAQDLLDEIESNKIKLPFIAHIITEDNMQHFVVVYKIKNNKFFIADPAKNKMKYSFEKFFSLWSGYVVTFEKTDTFIKGNYEKSSFKKFFSLLKGQYRILTTIIIFSLIISFIGMAGAFVFETIIDDFYSTNTAEVCEDDCTDEHEHITEEAVAENQNILEKIISFITNNASSFNVFFMVLIGLYILQALIQFARGYLISKLSKKIDIRLTLSYYNHVIDLPMAALATRNTGEYISRFSDASTIRNAVSGATLTLLLDSFMVIFCGVILFLENKILFCISLIMIILYAIVVLCYRKPIKNINRDVMENNARVQSFLKESIDGVETVKAHQAEALTKEKNTSKFMRFINAVFKESIIEVSQDSIVTLIEIIGIVIILWTGFSLVQANNITIGSLMTFYALLAYFTEPIKNLINLQPTVQSAIVAAERLNDILDISIEKEADKKNTSLEWNKISFDNVDFRYGNNELTLKNISFEIKKGERIAIVGESGCGKTTLAKLLMKFYTPEKGQIKIDDTDISELSILNVRNKISYVDQKTFLFSDTVKNNLLLSNPSASDEDIEKVCKLSKADEFINKLPFKYDTYLDENGNNLSGGQRQRLAIARVLLRNPKLLILDEATSNLDVITENAIKDTIFSLNQDLTCIIIAHRLNTIQNCDRIIVMENGRIAECGTPEELLKLKGKYYQLCNHQ